MMIIFQHFQQFMRENVVSRTIRAYRIHLFYGYIVIAMALFIGLGLVIKFIPFFPIDLVITRTIQQFHPAWFDFLMKAISLIGREPYWLILNLAVVLFLLFANWKWEAVTTAVTAGIVFILGSLIKLIIQRPRPGADLVNVFTHLHDWGFPSGHVLSYTAFLGFLLFLTFTLLPHSARRTVLLLILFLPVALIGVSRVYLGEHWTSDTLGAYLLGSVLLLLAMQLYNWGRGRWGIKITQNQTPHVLTEEENSSQNQ